MKEVLKCRDWRMMRWDEEWTKAQAWGCPCHAKKYPISTSVKAWGCPRGTPFFIGKNQVTFQDTIFLLLHALCIFLGASLLLLSVLFCFVYCNKWLDHIMFFWRRWTRFSFAKNTPFSLLSFQRVFSFSATAFSFCFSPWFLFRSYFIFQSRCIFASDLYWFSLKEVFIKSLKGVGKEKKLYAKIGTRRSLCRLRPRLLHVMLDIFLIVCLVVLL
jgi:hypothetical protein